jgi:Leucine-rich repeat (LRR) protein
MQVSDTPLLHPLLAHVSIRYVALNHNEISDLHEISLLQNLNSLPLAATRLEDIFALGAGGTSNLKYSPLRRL